MALFSGSRRMFALGSALSALALASCGGGESGQGSVAAPPAASPAPIGTPSPVPSPSPSPDPAPDPSPDPDEPSAPPPGTPPSGDPVLISEGDSISVFWAGNHTGIYATANPDIEMTGMAVGGSVIGNPADRGTAAKSLWSRIDSLLARRPTHVTVLIGANDLTDWRDVMNDARDPAPWLNRLFAYTDALRASGVRVAVGTVLPQCHLTNVPLHTLFQTRRQAANVALRAAVGGRIDGVIDFAADPRFGEDSDACNTAIFADGIHPEEYVQRQMADVYGPAANALLRH